MESWNLLQEIKRLRNSFPSESEAKKSSKYPKTEEGQLFVNILYAITRDVASNLNVVRSIYLSVFRGISREVYLIKKLITIWDKFSFYGRLTINIYNLIQAIVYKKLHYHYTLHYLVYVLYHTVLYIYIFI